MRRTWKRHPLVSARKCIQGRIFTGQCDIRRFAMRGAVGGDQIDSQAHHQATHHEHKVTGSWRVRLLKPTPKRGVKKATAARRPAGYCLSKIIQSVKHRPETARPWYKTPHSAAFVK